MIPITESKVGDKVHYQPDYYSKDRWDNGIIKEVPENSHNHVRVVYYCNGDWDNFKKYTSALTRISDLHPGWKH